MTTAGTGEPALDAAIAAGSYLGEMRLTRTDSPNPSAGDALLRAERTAGATSISPA